MGDDKKAYFQKKTNKYVRHLYLKYIRFFIKKPKKRIRSIFYLLKSKKKGKKAKNRYSRKNKRVVRGFKNKFNGRNNNFFLMFCKGWKRRRFYFKKLLKKNRSLQHIQKKRLGGFYGRRGRLVFELKRFKAFLFPKIREKKLKKYFQSRKHIYNHSLDNLVYHFEGMLGIFLMRMHFFYSLYGLKRILKHGLFKINNKIIKSCFYFFLPRDLLTFSETFFFYLKKKFKRNLKKRSSILTIPSFLEINYKFLWFLFYKSPEYSKNFPLNSADTRYKFLTPSWINMARNVSRF